MSPNKKSKKSDSVAGGHTSAQPHTPSTGRSLLGPPTQHAHFVVLNGAIRFDGRCAEAKPFCGALCCRHTFVLLTPEERASGRYDYIEPADNCNCDQCRTMRQTGRVALRKAIYGCIYLDGSHSCSIYENRPQVCRDFNCEARWWDLQLRTGGARAGGAKSKQQRADQDALGSAAELADRVDDHQHRDLTAQGDSEADLVWPALS